MKDINLLILSKFAVLILCLTTMIEIITSKNVSIIVQNCFLIGILSYVIYRLKIDIHKKELGEISVR